MSRIADCELPIADWNTKSERGRYHPFLATRSQGNRQSAIGNPRSNGFTLLEVLISLAIMAGIMAVIYASFSNAGRTVEQAEAKRDRMDLARTLVSKLSDDIANAYYNVSLKETVFYGKRSTLDKDVPRFDSVALTTLTNWRRSDSTEMDLWEVGYNFEDLPGENNKRLVRREKRDLKNSSPLEGGTDLEVTDAVAEMRLRYYDGITWQEEWDSRSTRTLPKAVEILLVLKDGSPCLTRVEVGR